MAEALAGTNLRLRLLAKLRVPLQFTVPDQCVIWGAHEQSAVDDDEPIEGRAEYVRKRGVIHLCRRRVLIEHRRQGHEAQDGEDVKTDEPAVEGLG